jgi:hypothetical protein
MASQFHEANRRRWDAGSASWAFRADTRGIWKKCHIDPSLALHSGGLKWLDRIAGKRIAVLGSGDNQVVFALAGLGAKVTSIDISEQQLEVARRIAGALGLDVEFLRGDVCENAFRLSASTPGLRRALASREEYRKLIGIRRAQTRAVLHSQRFGCCVRIRPRAHRISRRCQRQTAGDVFLRCQGGERRCDERGERDRHRVAGLGFPHACGGGPFPGVL